MWPSGTGTLGVRSGWPTALRADRFARQVRLIQRFWKRKRYGGQLFHEVAATQFKEQEQQMLHEEEGRQKNIDKQLDGQVTALLVRGHVRGVLQRCWGTRWVFRCTVRTRAAGVSGWTMLRAPVWGSIMAADGLLLV